MGQAAGVQKPFLTDVKTLRERARKNLDDGALGSNYVGDVNKTIEILQSVLATEIVCVLRYTQNAIAAHGISSESVKQEFAEHAKEEMDHERDGEKPGHLNAGDQLAEQARFFGRHDAIGGRPW